MREDINHMSPTTVAVINGELLYQSTLNDQGRADGKDHGVAGQLTTLAVYTQKAQEAWTNSPDDAAALDVIRKCAAICVRAMEAYGAVPRLVKNGSPAEAAIRTRLQGGGDGLGVPDGTEFAIGTEVEATSSEELRAKLQDFVGGFQFADAAPRNSDIPADDPLAPHEFFGQS